DYGRILDIVSSNNNYLVEKSDNSLVTEYSYHPALSVDLTDTSKPRNFCINEEPYFNFKKGIFLICNMFFTIEWSCLTAFNDVNTACSKFYNILNNIFEKTVSKLYYKGRQGRYFPPWFNNEIFCL
ncbi:hypothetical protein BDFB_014282, partial [Asbolus verrucosus]